MSVLLVGSEGSMGRRYQAILSYLNVPYQCVDKNHTLEQIKEKAWESERIIIATPTNTHYELITNLLEFDRPILCEKPVTKDVNQLDDLLEQIERHETAFEMVMQYKFLAHPGTKGDSVYNYFRHGNDGLVWDCMQIIGLAKGPIDLLETSPMWYCTINGFKLNLSQMDRAYIQQVESWLEKPFGDLREIMRVHEKTAQYEKAFLNGSA